MAKIYKRVCSVCKRELVYQHGKKPKSCACGNIYFFKPDYEQRLFLLQDKMLSAGKLCEKNMYLEKMVKILHLYSKKLIVKLVAPYRYPASELEEKTNDLVGKFMIYYLEGIVIEQSFAGYIKRIAKGVCFGGKKHERHLSLDAHYEETDKNFHDSKLTCAEQDLFKSHEDVVLNNASFNNISTEVFKIIEKIYDKIVENYGRERGFLFLVGVKNKVFNNYEKFSEFFSGTSTEDVDKSFLIVRNYLKEVSNA